MVIKIIGAIITICFTLLITALANVIIKVKKDKKKISIKESLELTDLPILTFKSGNNNIRFMVDTGSSNSFVSSLGESLLSKKEFVESFNHTCVTGSGVSNTDVKSFTSNINYKEMTFCITTITREDLDIAFDSIRQESGVTIHGILGNDFLKKYKYVIDYADLVIYNK